MKVHLTEDECRFCVPTDIPELLSSGWEPKNWGSKISRLIKDSPLFTVGRKIVVELVSSTENNK